MKAQTIGFCGALILALLTHPSPPVATWTAPGQLTIEYAGGVLWYQKPNQPAVFLDCPSPCVLRTGGTDGLYTAQAGASAWVQNEAGEDSPATVVPPHVVFLPVVVVPTTQT